MYYINKCKVSLIPIVVFTYFFNFQLVFAKTSSDEDADYFKYKTKLLTHLISQQLLQEHYSKKKLNDDLSVISFDLFIKQLDPQKRFFLKEDISILSKYRNNIDDEIKNQNLELPLIAENIFNKRVKQLQESINTILSKDFDFYLQDSLETDFEKIDFCNNFEELVNRWNSVLKYQVEIKYLDLLEEEKLPLPATINKTSSDSEDAQLQALRKKAREKILKSYDEYFNRLLEKESLDFINGYYNAVANAFDPHSNYMPPEDKEDFDIHMSGSLEGIGARLRENDGYIQVVSIMPGGAADRQGQLEADDIILKVAEGEGDPVEITGMAIRDAVSLIRGKKGTLVRLAVKKTDGEHINIPIIRDVVQIEETFVKSTVLEDKNRQAHYGYVKIPAFYRDFKKAHNGGDGGRNSTDDVKGAIEELRKKNIQGIILDLRNNGGGALVDAVSIAGLFIKEGPIVQVKDANGKIQIHSDEDPEVVYEGPLAVLVNRISASASEILAGAIQDYGRGIIVGSDHTHGKGTVQTIIDLDHRVLFANMRKYLPLGAVKVTIQKFYRINGDSMQFRGVVPDIILPDNMQHLEYGERYLEHSLPWDKVDSLKYSKLDSIGKKLGSLQEKHQKRLESNEIFHEIIIDAKRVEERRKRTLVSLNIIDAWKDREELRNQKKNRRWSAGFHGMGDDEGGGGISEEETGESKTKKTTEQDRNDRWLKGLQNDPYIGEVMQLLNDMILG